MPVDVTKRVVKSWTTKDVSNQDTLTVSLTWLVVDSPLTPTAKLVDTQIICDKWINDTHTKEVKVEAIKFHDDQEVCQIIDGKKICRKESYIGIKSYIEVTQMSGPQVGEQTKPGKKFKTEQNGGIDFLIHTSDYEKVEEAN